MASEYFEGMTKLTSHLSAAGIAAGLDAELFGISAAVRLGRRVVVDFYTDDYLKRRTPFRTGAAQLSGGIGDDGRIW